MNDEIYNEGNVSKRESTGKGQGEEYQKKEGEEEEVYLRRG